MIHTAKRNELSEFGGEVTSRDALCREALARVLESDTFRRCPRLREFLHYVSQRALAGLESEITEQRIGEEVFGRSGRFNPSEDNIVRATARSLRAKLRDYYDTEGARETIRIEIPKGAYLPCFVSVDPFSAAPASVPEHKKSFVRWLPALLSLGLIIVVAWLAANNIQLRSRLDGGGAQPTLLTALFGENEPVHIVASDGLHHYLQDLRGELTAFEEYASHRVFNAPGPPENSHFAPELWNLIRNQNLTNYQDVRTAVQLAQHLGGRRLVKFQHARSLSLDTLQLGENIVLLGGRRANPWVGLFESSLDFQMDFSETSETALIRNLNPHPGEQTEYQTEMNEQQTGNAYGRVALIPGMSGKGKVLLVAGTNGYATLAAGDVLLQPRMFDEIERLLRKPVDASLARLEVLVETSAVGGGTRDFRIIAVH